MIPLTAIKLGGRLVIYVALAATAETEEAAKKIIRGTRMPINEDHRFHVSLAGITPKDGNYTEFRRRYEVSEDRQRIVLKVI